MAQLWYSQNRSVPVHRDDNIESKGALPLPLTYNVERGRKVRATQGTALVKLQDRSLSAAYANRNRK